MAPVAFADNVVRDAEYGATLSFAQRNKRRACCSWSLVIAGASMALLSFAIAAARRTPPDCMGETPIRYTLFSGRIGAPTRIEYVRSLADVGVWIAAAPLPARLLSRLGARSLSFRYQHWWARGLARAISMQVDITGLEYVGDEAYIVTPLHEGLADALALLHLPLPLRFVLRDEFVDWRPIGGFLQDTGQIVIRPEDGMRAYRTIVRDARASVERGESVVICPQGTILGVETAFQPGAFAIAEALRCPILPVVLTGTHRVWEFPFSPRLRRGMRVSLEVLPPISAANVRAMGRDALRVEVQQRLKSAALDGTRVPPRRYIPARDGYWDGFAFGIDPAFPELAADLEAHREEMVEADSARVLSGAG